MREAGAKVYVANEFPTTIYMIAQLKLMGKRVELVDRNGSGGLAIHGRELRELIRENKTYSHAVPAAVEQIIALGARKRDSANN